MITTIRLGAVAAFALTMAACAPRSETVRTSTVETTAPAVAPTTTTTQTTYADPYSGTSRTVTQQNSQSSLDATTTERTRTTTKWP
jgi:ABC-type uncharacterized transport system auxiliary subunit